MERAVFFLLVTQRERAVLRAAPLRALLLVVQREWVVPLRAMLLVLWRERAVLPRAILLGL